MSLGGYFLLFAVFALRKAIDQVRSGRNLEVGTAGELEGADAYIVEVVLEGEMTF